MLNKEEGFMKTKNLHYFLDWLTTKICFREYLYNLKHNLYNKLYQKCFLIGAVSILLLISIMGCSNTITKQEYGVFLSINSSEIEKLLNYKEVVIDAQYFSKDDIDYLHKSGIKVYSYINVGSIENFRDYYSKYEYLTLGEYENWEEEKWVDVSNHAWKTFMEELSSRLSEKGIDGFFVDNCDIYYHYPKDNIFNSIIEILKNLKNRQKEVIINGGDFFVYRYLNEQQNLDIISAVNQESVFTTIDFKYKKFGKRADTKHYIDYIQTCKNAGLKVYLLEYTDNPKLIKEIQEYCKRNGFYLYISDSIELD